MLRATARRFTALILVLVPLSTSIAGAGAETAAGPARRGPAMTSAQVPLKKPCNLKRRALAGAAVGAAIAMVAVRKAARSNGGSVGAKGTVQAGGYGAALGSFIGLTTCR